MDILKETIDNMISEGVIFDGGKGDLESFYISDFILPSKENSFADCIDDANSLKHMQKFIDVKFQNIIDDRIKNQLNDKLFNLNLKHIAIKNDSIYQERNQLYETMKSEITFLRQLIESKDKTIEQLIIRNNQLNSGQLTREANNNEVKLSTQKLVNKEIELSKDKCYINLSKKVNGLPLNNRFGTLSEDYHTEKDFHINVINDEYPESIKESEAQFEYQNKRNKKKSHCVTTILGDSMLKDIKTHKMRKDVGINEKLFIKNFPGATTKSMESYVIPSLEYNPDLVILHCGTNSLRTDFSPTKNAEDIAKLAETIKNDENEVMVSSIIQRDDHLRDKVKQVNQILSKLCFEKNIGYIDNDNITNEQLNNSGLHLNFKGTATLANNLLRAIRI